MLPQQGRGPGCCRGEECDWNRQRKERVAVMLRSPEGSHAAGQEAGARGDGIEASPAHQKPVRVGAAEYVLFLRTGTPGHSSAWLGRGSHAEDGNLMALGDEVEGGGDHVDRNDPTPGWAASLRPSRDPVGRKGGDAGRANWRREETKCSRKRANISVEDCLHGRLRLVPDKRPQGTNDGHVGLTGPSAGLEEAAVPRGWAMRK